MGYYDGRLCVYNDEYDENGFVVKTTEQTFARVNKIKDKWCLWSYLKHRQYEFQKLREALVKAEEEFAAWYRCES